MSICADLSVLEWLGDTHPPLPIKVFLSHHQKIFRDYVPSNPSPPPHNEIVLYTQFLICIFKIKEYVLQVKTKAPKIEEKHLESGLHSAQTLKIKKMYRVLKKCLNVFAHFSASNVSSDRVVGTFQLRTPWAVKSDGF